MKNKKSTILLIILAVLVIIAGGLLIYKIINREKTVPVIEEGTNVDSKDSENLVVQQNKVKII